MVRLPQFFSYIGFDYSFEYNSELAIRYRGEYQYNKCVDECVALYKSIYIESNVWVLASSNTYPYKSNINVSFHSTDYTVTELLVIILKILYSPAYKVGSLSSYDSTILNVANKTIRNRLYGIDGVLASRECIAYINSITSFELMGE